ncbi:hypothetical protein LU276_01100 [Moraxella haemolytica]|uniref:hypothetical protein n=1 Tax=Moraxella TaxID=475 RepID=UPI002542D764|nr:hypothetical protein [Moraxella sp. ZY171148]WII95481.1 hypothetical protein LU276_01100 [Moraxella sp. ZY171148]
MANFSSLVVAKFAMLLGAYDTWIMPSIAVIECAIITKIYQKGSVFAIKFVNNQH